MTSPEEAKARLRILIVTQYFWPENFQINHLSKALRDRGHAVTVLTGKPNYPAGRFMAGYSMFGRRRDDFDGIPVIRVPLIARGGGGGLRLALNYLSFVVSGVLLGPRWVKGPFDCIFVYEPSPITVGLPAMAMRRATGAPIIFWLQDLWPESVTAATGRRWKIFNAPLNWLVRFIYSACEIILIQSQAFREPVTRAGVDPRRIVFWPQSVDPLFQPAPPAADAPEALTAPGFRVVFAGNIGQAQDFETIVEAADRLRDYPDVRWIIIGDGRRYAWLKQEVERRGLDHCVRLLGRHPEDAMPGLFACADALLVTLRREPIFALTIPTKIQAYMACGKPIIAGLDGEGARVVEEAGAGVTVAASDPEKLAEAVLTVRGLSADERSAMGRNGLRYSREKFDREMLLDRLEELFMTTIAEARRETIDR